MFDQTKLVLPKYHIYSICTFSPFTPDTPERPFVRDAVVAKENNYVSVFLSEHTAPRKSDVEHAKIS